MYDYLKTTIFIDVRCQGCNRPKQLGEMFADTHRGLLLCVECLKQQEAERETMKGRISYLPDFFGELLAVFDTTTAGIPTKVGELCDQLKQAVVALMKTTMEKLDEFAQQVSEMCIAASSRAKRYSDQQLLNQQIVEKLNDRTLSAKDIKKHLQKRQRINQKSYVEHMACSCDQMADLLRRIAAFELKLPQVEEIPPTKYHVVCDSPVLSAAAQNGYIATASAMGVLATLAGSRIVGFKGHEGQARSLSWYESYLVSGGDDYKIKVWQIEESGDLKLLKSFGDGFEKNSYHRNVLALQRYGLIITCTGINDAYKLRCWNYETQSVEFQLEGHQDYIKTLTEVPNSPYVISSSSDRTLRVWDILHRRTRQLIHNHQKIVMSAYINRLGLIVVLEEGNYIGVYPLAIGSTLTPRLSHWKVSKSVTAMCVVEQLNIAIAGSGFVEVWSATGQHKQTIPLEDKRKISQILYHNRTLFGCQGTGKLLELSLKPSKHPDLRPPVMRQSSSN